jgi:S-adenosylmethionine hydrolase
MHIVTLTSDWIENDYYVASLKGKLLSKCPETRIVDINHKIKPFNTAQAAFVVRNSFPNFPDDTIHIIAVNSEPQNGGQLLAARMANQYFLCADNGMLGLLGGPKPEKVVRLKDTFDHQSTSFISLSVFVEVACAIANGTPLDELGTLTDQYDKQVPLRPTIEDSKITGSVIHIDSYENAITNISKELFERVGKGNPYQIFVQSKHYKIDKVSNRYNDTPPGELLAIFNAAGLLEIAMRNGNAASLLKLNTSSTVRVEFKGG